MSNAIKIQNPGFFILELLVAMAIMSILWLVIARYQGASIGIVHNAQQRMRAVNLASNTLDHILATKKLPGVQKKEVDEFTITWKIRPHNLGPPQYFTQHAAYINHSFHIVTINITWSSNNHKQSVQLTSGMVRDKEQ